ncbi:hypothetical protein CWIS_13650 [Cellulomonas sp. A375-1]|uniref:hypothetical protein n=1 Tax=Cellulomonas sp. A375-1 TaxID=1672219 RepID=UPI00065268CF|nr:hypothetical protein [Cellulomonas sp. A375-1]KMM44867.1 hypothetical protein CWIS_13650 [Cellulomonas sp. A375-1]
MSTKQHVCPSGKVRYRDRLDALLALSKIGRKDSPRRPGSEQRAYPCPRCKGWHLTSTDRRRAA